MSTRHPLRFLRVPAPAYPLPPSLTRSFLSTPSGPLEFLHASHPPNNTHLPPLLFQHGGFCQAATFVAWMDFFAARGYPVYAVSLRGHGLSWQPLYLRLWMGTSKYDMAQDLLAAVREVQRREQERNNGKMEGDMVLLGHSAGGGLAQLALSRGLMQVRALVLLAAVPGYGSMPCYSNWGAMDPWFMLRSLFHLQHPRSPLSSTSLVHQAFFCAAYPLELVRRFEEYMSENESLRWAVGMMRRFVDFGRICGNILGWKDPRTGSTGTDRVCVVGGGMDRLMTPPLMRRLADEFRTARGEKAGVIETVEESEEAVVERGGGVRVVIEEGAGHMLQNDLQQEVGAKRVLEFLEQL